MRLLILFWNETNRELSLDTDFCHRHSNTPILHVRKSRFETDDDRKWK